MLRARRARLLALLAGLLALVLVIAACETDDDEEVAEEPEEEPDDEEPPEDEPDDEETPEEEEEEVDPAVEAWPERDIRVIITFSPGGASDVEARRIEEELEDELGVSLNIDYVEGAGGAVGFAEAAAAEPDGYTVVISTFPHQALQPMMGDEAGYETDDFEYAYQQVIVPSGFAVHEDAPWADFDEFIEDVEERPGEITVGGVGRFSGSDTVTAAFMDESGLDVTYVPIEGGGGPVIADLQGQHTDAAGLPPNHPIRVDDIRPLVIAGEERMDQIPDIPTFSEYGWDVNIFFSWGWAFPAGTPDPIVEEFAEIVDRVLEEGDHFDDIIEDGYQPGRIMYPDANEWAQEQVDTYEDLVPLLEALEDQ